MTRADRKIRPGLFMRLRGRQEITFTNMTPGFWRLARRPRGAYPSRPVGITSGQRGQRSKDQVRLERLFLGGPLSLLPHTHAPGLTTKIFPATWRLLEFG